MSSPTNMKSGCRGYAILLATMAAITAAAETLHAEPIVTLGNTAGQQTLYSYNTNYSGYDATGDGWSKLADATENDIWWGMEYSSPTYAFLYPTIAANPGIITWHFQAAPGSTIKNDVAVKWAADFFDHDEFDTTDNNIWGYWSTGDENWTPFAYATGVAGEEWTRVASTRSLSETGYSGGSDLYVRFAIYDPVGTTTSQLFRSTPGAGAAFVVTGTVSPVPEPSTLVGLATGLIGLAACAWRKRKACGA
jgi:hypothetical protein